MAVLAQDLVHVTVEVVLVGGEPAGGRGEEEVVGDAEVAREQRFVGGLAGHPANYN